MKVYVHIFYGKDGEEYEKRYNIGLEPDLSPYGLHNANGNNIHVKFSRDAPRRTIWAKLLYRILGFDFVHAVYNRSAIESADVVWTMTEREAFAVACLFRLRLVKRRPIIANAVWIFNEWDSLPVHLKMLYKDLSREISIMTVHSSECLPRIRKYLPHLKTELTYFGINDDLFQNKSSIDVHSDRIILFAAGNDRTRDWQTMLDAFGNDQRFEIVIACQWVENIIKVNYTNLTILKKPSMRDFMYWYNRSDFVVIPMVDNIYSGITVALEAAAMQKAIISSRTGGVPTYFSDDEIIYVPSGSHEEMRDAAINTSNELRRQFGIRARGRFVRNDYSTKALARRYIELTKVFM